MGREYGRWFRFYDAALDDPKVQRLPAELFKTWVNLLCLASRNAGELPHDVADLAYSLRLSVTETQSQLQALVAAGLMDEGEDGIVTPHNWSERQFQSDTSRERVKRHRERAKKQDEPVTCNVTCNVTETLPVTPSSVSVSESVSSSVSEGEEAVSVGAPPTRLPTPDDVTLAFAAYNATAAECGLPQAQRMTDARRSALRKRLAECGGLDGWHHALNRVRGSPFLCGQSQSGWRADLDFLLQPKSFTRLMEGAYDRTQAAPDRRRADFLAGVGDWLAERSGSGDGVPEPASEVAL